jgi:hypothetical protein
MGPARKQVMPHDNSINHAVKNQPFCRVLMKRILVFVMPPKFFGFFHIVQPDVQKSSLIRMISSALSLIGKLY